MGNLRRPRVLMIAPLPPPVHGSAMMTQYIKESKKINNAVKMDWVNLSLSRNINEIGKNAIFKIGRFVNSWVLTFKKLLTKKYDYCYLAITCHGIGFLKDMPFALLCKLFGYQLIIHQHNKGMESSVNNPFYRVLMKLVYKNAIVILLSERLYPDISKIVMHDQVVICPNGIPTEKRLDKTINKIPRLLFLSNLIESKGVFILLDACKILLEEGYNFDCVFIGGETKEIDKRVFEEEILLRGLENRVKYIGKKFGVEKSSEFAKSDIFIFPTFYENECFPLVILEAMQQGVAVISTNEGGIPDIILNGKSGIIVETKDSFSLAGSIKKLIDSPEYRIELGQNGYLKYSSEYTLQHFEENIIKILSP